MEIILNQDLDELGFEGDIINVANGYARNYLIPKGIALEASPRNRKAFELRSKKIELKRLKAREEAEKVKEELEKVEVTFSHKAGEEGKLYGSVTNVDIASELEKQDIVIDRRKILLEKPIKTLGEFEVRIRIYPEVISSIKVTVTPEQEKQE
ncbi:MAG: 50S ribosomal protein L9 [Desulfobacterales bacterium]|nr:50S ribosomal protein L9 [Desulfobacterales bacterium]